MQLRPRHNRRRSVTGGNFPTKSKTVGYLTELPPELQSDILLRLPVKSLLFCKCVCKSLRTLISNPNFVQSHLTRINSLPKSLILHCKNATHLMLYTQTGNPDNVSTLSFAPLLAQIPHHKYTLVYVVGSSNGLILIVVWLGDFDSADYALILWNPVIGQHRFLPKPHFRFSGIHEFGFIPELNDYVVLKIGRTEPVIELYKLSSDSWITVDFDLSWRGSDSLSKISTFANPLFLNGSFHWDAWNISDIVYYNIKDEKLGVIKAVDCDRRKRLAGYPGYGNYLKKLAVMDQSLAMIYYKKQYIFTLEIWVMNDYGVEDSWDLKFLIREKISDYQNYLLAGYWTSGLMIINEQSCEGLDLRRPVGTFMLYDVNTRSTMKIARLPKDHEIGGFCSFVETLVPLIKVD